MQYVLCLCYIIPHDIHNLSYTTHPTRTRRRARVNPALLLKDFRQVPTRLTNPPLRGEFDMAPLGFLDLPAELRLQIYETVITSPTDSVKDHLDWYKGFMMSCKTIYREVEYELVKNTNKHLVKMSETWDEEKYEDTESAPLRISNPSTIAEVQSNIRVYIPHSWIRQRCNVDDDHPCSWHAHQRCRRIPKSLTLLFPLHLTRLIITTHEDETPPTGVDQLAHRDHYAATLFNEILDMLKHRPDRPPLLMNGSVCDGMLACDALTLASDLRARSSQSTPQQRLILAAPLYEDNHLSYRRPDVTTYERSYSLCCRWKGYSYEIEDVFDTDGSFIGMTYHRLAEIPPFDLAIEDRREPRDACALRVIAKSQQEQFGAGTKRKYEEYEEE